MAGEDLGFPAVFWELHARLPRQGPGADAATRRAFFAAGPLPPRPVVVDVGCGPGAQTLELVRLLGSRVVAFDTHAPFLDELRERAVDAGVADLVDARLGDMHALPLAAGSVDLLWSEGAVYIIGFEHGLRTWRDHLRPGGVVVVSEASWLTGGAPAEVRQFWDEAYPTMGSRDDNVARAERAGYRVRSHFPLPAEAWWRDYYDPLLARLAEFRPRHANDPEAGAVLDAEAREIDLFRRYHAYYGYVFYVLERAD